MTINYVDSELLSIPANIQKILRNWIVAIDCLFATRSLMVIPMDLKISIF